MTARPWPLPPDWGKPVPDWPEPIRRDHYRHLPTGPDEIQLARLERYAELLRALDGMP